MQMAKAYMDDELTANPPKWMPWVVCIAASLFLFYECIQGNMFASIANDIMRDFHIHADKMTYLSSMYYVSNVIFLFVAGMVLDRFSPKKTMLIAMLFCVLSTFVLAKSNTFYVALVCRFIVGIGSAFCFLGPIRIASRWFLPQQMAMVTGMVVTISMMGGLLAQYPLTRLVLDVGWREALLLIAWMGVALFFMMVFLVKDRSDAQATEAPTQQLTLLATMKKAYLNLQTWRAALYASLVDMPVAVFGAMMGSLYLMQRLHVTQDKASMINSMLFVGAIVGGPVMGWLSDRLSLRLLPMKLGLLASLTVVLAVLYLPVSYVMMIVLFFFLGLFTSSQVISYALVAESAPLTMTATAVSMVSILTQGGYVVYQNLFSTLLTRHGGLHIVNDVPVYSLADYQFAAIVLPLGLLVALFAIKGLRETHCRHIQEA